MKNTLLILSSTILFFTACKTEKKEALQIDKGIVFTDTSLLKQGNYSTDVAPAGNIEPAVLPQEKNTRSKPEIRTITKIIRVVEKKRPIAIQNPQPPATAPVVETPAPVAQTPAPSTGTNTDVVKTSEPAKKNEGWSGAAKGAAMGGIGGAVAGAVIGKKKGKSAIIGGIIGAAGGYILGRNADKKSGRANIAEN